MDTRTLRRLIYSLLAGLWLAACASPPATPPPNLVETEVAVQRAAIATLTAEAPAELPTVTPLLPTPNPPATTAASPPPQSDTLLPPDTPTSAPTPEPQLPATATPTPLPRCIVTANALNLRLGPGTVYEPPLLALPIGAELAPLAFSPAGFPSGQWLQVQLSNSAQSGWVSVGPQFINCNIDPAALPIGVAPPTPTPPPTSTPTPLPPPPPPPERVTLPPDGGKDASGLEGQIVIPFNVEVTSDGLAIFRDRLAFRVEVFDPHEGHHDGAGISEVTITIRDNENNDRVHQRTERTAGYCVFGGGEPDCNVLVLAHNNYRWPDGENMVSGKYNVNFNIVRDDGSDADWIWSFLLQR